MSTKTKFGRERSWVADAGGGFVCAAPGDVQPTTALPIFLPLPISLPLPNPGAPATLFAGAGGSVRTQEYY